MSATGLPGDFACICPACESANVKLVIRPPQWVQNRIRTSRSPAGTCEETRCLYVGRWSEFVMAGWDREGAAAIAECGGVQ